WGQQTCLCLTLWLLTLSENFHVSRILERRNDRLRSVCSRSGFAHVRHASWRNFHVLIISQNVKMRVSRCFPIHWTPCFVNTSTFQEFSKRQNEGYSSFC